MDAFDYASQAEPLRARGTLGAVLYSGNTGALVAEQEWAVLVQAVAAGEERALHALYDRTHRLVYTLAVRITTRPETAEEVTLDVFHDVWRRAGTYDPANGTVLGWIMNQARSRAIDRLRHEQRKKRVDPQLDGALPPSAASEPHEMLELGELRRALGEALKLLTHEERQAIQTAFFSELTYAEAAARLNEPLGTIKTRIRSGLAKLRKALEGTQR